MESLGMNPTFWKGKRVFLTGHTGFKGGWIAHWLDELGAFVHGYSLEPPTRKSFFFETQLQQRLASSTISDIRDLSALVKALKTTYPDIIIHMAAQPLVRDSYAMPVETFSANVMGTVNLFEAARQVGTAKALVNITTDKCYENNEWLRPYCENDRLGGHDPYSASKACAEIVSAAYRNSFLTDAGICLASARAGNVIGGGDWATGRLIPDFLRALDGGEVLSIRSPNSVRPWQHVLEPLSGYLLLAEKLYTEGIAFAEAWNFGPDEADAKPVSWLVDKLCACAPATNWKIDHAHHPHEASELRLNSNKAKVKLGWEPRWSLETALENTLAWHHAWRNNDDMTSITSKQIKSYVSP